jgi:DNA-binding GntR family transcriptional regulator
MKAFFSPLSDSGSTGDTQGTLSLRTISRVSLKDTVVLRIREAIECGELGAGETVTELGLARKLGVAQPTIREALLELEFIGYVERTPTRKIRVTLLTRRSIDNIYLVRTRLETLAVELLAAQKSPQLQSCSKHLQEMETAAAKGLVSEFCHADLEFHRALWSSSQNEYVEGALERIVPKLFAFVIFPNSRRGSVDLVEVCELHRRLLDMILEGDAVAACQLMNLSMQKAWFDDVLTLDSETPAIPPISGITSR